MATEPVDAGVPEGQAFKSALEPVAAGEMVSKTGWRVKENSGAEAPTAVANPFDIGDMVTRTGWRLKEAATSPEFQKLAGEVSAVSENVDRQAGAVNLVEAYVKWAETTGDKKVTELLTGNVADVVQGLAKNPDKVSKAVEVWTEEDVESFKKKLSNAGLITVEQQKEPQKPIPANEVSSEKATDGIKDELKSAPPTIEPPTTTAK